MEIEPIFTDENWVDLLKDLSKIGENFIIECNKSDKRYVIIGSTINPYGNKIEVIIPIQARSEQFADRTFAVETKFFNGLYIELLAMMIERNPHKNNVFSFSLKLLDMIKEKSDDIYRKELWNVIQSMQQCYVRVYTVNNIYLQSPLIKISLVKILEDKEYPLSFNLKIFSEDMANSYKHGRQIHN